MLLLQNLVFLLQLAQPLELARRLNIDLRTFGHNHSVTNFLRQRDSLTG